MYYLVNELREWQDSILSLIPGQIGKYLRKLRYKLICDTGFCLRTIDNGKVVHGHDIYCNKNVVIDASCNGQVYIGSWTIIGYNVVIRTSNHNIENQVILHNGHKAGKVIIGNNCWIGANCVLLDGTILGDNVVIGAGAVVNSEIPSDSIAIGVPARVIKKRIYNETTQTEEDRTMAWRNQTQHRSNRYIRWIHKPIPIKHNSL